MSGGRPPALREGSFALALVALTAGAVPAQSLDHLSKACQGDINRDGRVVANNPIVLGQVVIPLRLPEPRVLLANCSGPCIARADSQVAEWRRRDIANWDRVSNRTCSHMLGWVEKNPGTCRAGGPPPICPVDHWTRVPTSPDFWREKEEEVRREREERLRERACGDWATDLRVSMYVSASGDGIRQPPPGTLTIPSTTKCPPGTSPFQGRCVTSSANPLSPTAAGAVQMSVQIGIEQGLSLLSATAAKIFGSFSWTLGGAFVTGATPAHSGSMLTSWENANRRVDTRIQQINHAWRKLGNRPTSFGGFEPPPGRVAAYEKRLEDLHRLASDLDQSLQWHQVAYDGVRTERLLPPNACYEVYEVYHDRMHQLGRSLVRDITRIP